MARRSGRRPAAAARWTRAGGTAAPATSASRPWPRPAPGTATAPRPAPGLERQRHRPAGPGGWNGNGSPADTGGWNRNGTPAGPGGWNRTGSPADTGGWNGNGPAADTGGWNRNGSPADTGRLRAPAAGARTGAGANGHGMASWNGMAGPDGMLDAPAPPAPGRRRQGPQTGRRSARKQRIPTRAIFSELADLAAIPRSAYALEQESDGAMCLLRTEEGFEVFSAADGARHEVRSFDDEEAAYFYLFGVLAAEAVRNGSLTPPR